jgi:hypothetical protein
MTKYRFGPLIFLLVLLGSSLLFELDVVVVAGVGSGHVEAVPESEW